MYDDVAIIIPARLGSQRLPSKPLQKIGGYAMIEHVYRQVKKTGINRLYVTTDSTDIAEVITKINGTCILTRPECHSGTERVYEAFNKIVDRSDIKYVINVQGDMPFIEPEVILTTIGTLKHTSCDIVTPAAKVDEAVASSASVVKVVKDSENRALYFSRSLIPYGAGEYLYHVGVYGFKLKSLERFVALNPSELEKREQLEQLKALENGMSIEICYVDSVPISVDTPEDLAKAIEYYDSIA